MGESNTIRIGDPAFQTTTFIAGISGATVPTGIAVIVDTSGHLGTTTSSARFKQNIKPMDKASETILALKPVTFCYKQVPDPQGIPQFGLVAEEVEKVNPDLVAHDADGKAYTVRYEAVNAMLLNEFLKEHRKGQEQDATISQLQTELAQQQREIKALSVQIQKVSAQIELSKSGPQTVLNDQ
jgi:peptidoglycan hydrolase CwlO-like protein